MRHQVFSSQDADLTWNSQMPPSIPPKLMAPQNLKSCVAIFFLFLSWKASKATVSLSGWLTSFLSCLRESSPIQYSHRSMCLLGSWPLHVMNSIILQVTGDLSSSPKVRPPRCPALQGNCHSKWITIYLHILKWMYSRMYAR